MESNVTIAGHLGSEVNYRSGITDAARWSRAEFRLAHTRRVRRPDGSWIDGPTTWVTVQAWRQLADHCRESLAKGDPVLVTGRLHTDEWADENGELRSRLIVQAESIGHDLTRGCSRFRKTVAIPEPGPAGREDADEDPGENAPEDVARRSAAGAEEAAHDLGRPPRSAALVGADG